MNKLTWILNTITICCVILPLLFTVIAFQDNVLGLLAPPEITAAMSGNDQTIQERLPDFSNLRIVEPTYNDDFQFNLEDGTYGFSINVTSPLDTPITVNSLHVTVTDENVTILGTINWGNPVTLVPGKNSTIPIEGVLSPELITQLQDSGVDPTDPHFNPENIKEIVGGSNNLHITNINLNIDGIQIHVDELNPDELFESQESD